MGPKDIMSVVVVLILLVVGIVAVATITTETDPILEETTQIETIYLEEYDDDTVDENPSETWYSYYESGLPYQNTSNDTYYNGNNSFRMNTTEDSDTTGGCLYNFTLETTYDEFDLNFKINQTHHNFTIVTVGAWIPVLDTSGAICYWNITNETVTFYVLTLDGIVYTEVWNQSINPETWYLLHAEFNYENHGITSQIWNNEPIQGPPIVIESGGATCFIPFTNLTQSFWAIAEAHGADSCRIYFDDFQLTDITYGIEESELVDTLAIANSVISMIGILLIVSAIMAIIYVVKVR